MSEIIAQGAEAILIKSGNELTKRRIKKSYRLQELDEKLRSKRTRSEAKIIGKLRGIISVPKIIKVDEKNKEIIMEFIPGKKLSENLEQLDWKNICLQLGQEITKLHSQNIIHGDLTTSNMIFYENNIYLIDFGLGFYSTRIEDKAVDLHLLRQALEAKHFTIWAECFKEVLKGYNNKEVETQLTKVEKRGRYHKNAQ